MRLLTFIRLELKAFSADIKYFMILPLIPILVLLSLNPLLRFLQEESASSTGFRIAIADQSDSGLVHMAVSSILQSASLGRNIEALQVTEEEARQLIEENEIAAAIVITENFLEAVQAGSPSPIEILLNDRQPMQAALLREGLQSAGAVMGDVQNVLYMINQYARQAEGLDAGAVFDESMLTLIYDALGRDDIYQTQSISPYGEVDPILYYGIDVLLLFLCFSSFYQLLKQTGEQRLARVRRERLTNVPGLLFPVAEGLAMGVLLFLQGLIPCACLLLLTGCLSASTWLVWSVLLLICLGLGLLARLVQMCVHRTASALLLLSGIYASTILLSGILIPPAFLSSGLWSGLQYFALPQYWSQALLTAVSGGQAFISFMGVLTLCVLILFPALCILLMGGLRHAGKELY